MSFSFRNVVSALVLLPCYAWAQDDLPSQDEYAWQFHVNIQEPAEYLEARIPLGVYRSVSDPQLRDLGIYDAKGRPVPRLAQHLAEEPDDLEVRLPLGIIPLYGEAEQTQETLRLLMERNQAGTRFEFDSGSVQQDETPENLQAYIVGLQSLEGESFNELEFEWNGGASGFIGRVVIEQSNDLARWIMVAQGTLADLRHEDTEIRNTRIEVAPNLRNYLRITWRDMPENWKLESLTGIRHERQPDYLRDSMVISPVERSEDGRAFMFDIGGYFPVDRAGLQLQGQNEVVRAAIEFRATPESEWRPLYEGLHYSVSQDGNELRSSPRAVSRTKASQWRVRVLSGRVDEDAYLYLGWLPGRVLFLAQGEAPYTLVSGRAQAAQENFPQHRLMGDSSLFSVLLDNRDPGIASIGLRQENAGMVAMQDARTWTWRTVGVWIGLFAAVAFVGWLVLSLMRENKNKESG